MTRIERFLKAIGEQKLDAFLVTGGIDLRYLSHFSGSAGMLWVSSEHRVFITDFRYESQAKAEVGENAEIYITSPDKGYLEIIEELGLVENVKYTGFDSGNVNYDLYRRLCAKFMKTNWIPVANPVSDIRAQKEPAEIERIHQAAKIAMESLAETLPLLRPGITEKEFAAELEYRMRKKGSEKSPFDIIVASGWRAALPHGAASDKSIAAGEMIVIDFGATYGGYAADITRTFFLGTPDEKFKKIYNTVLTAQEAAIEYAKTGKTGKEIDQVAREIIENAGFGENFGHGLGHGLGLAVHDAPTLNKKNEKPIPDNAVVTVEPGIYIENWGGVRIEDDIIISESGAKIITDELPKKLSDVMIPVG